MTDEEYRRMLEHEYQRTMDKISKLNKNVKPILLIEEIPLYLTVNKKEKQPDRKQRIFSSILERCRRIITLKWLV